MIKNDGDFAPHYDPVGKERSLFHEFIKNNVEDSKKIYATIQISTLYSALQV
jgi:hypothetical protein